MAVALKARGRNRRVGFLYVPGLVLMAPTCANPVPAPAPTAADHGAADVRPLLREARQSILAGVVVLFTRVLPLDCADPSAHPLWQLATKARGEEGATARRHRRTGATSSRALQAQPCRVPISARPPSAWPTRAALVPRTPCPQLGAECVREATENVTHVVATDITDKTRWARSQVCPGPVCCA